jgi:hypothetical protein
MTMLWLGEALLPVAVVLQLWCLSGWDSGMAATWEYGSDANA